VGEIFLCPFLINSPTRFARRGIMLNLVKIVKIVKIVNIDKAAKIVKIIETVKIF
jgi:hypothetical protein